MDKISKALKKLSDKERIALRAMLLKIKAGNLSGFDIKKLKGMADIFRARKGKLRIIFKNYKDGTIAILALERRNDNTYDL